MAIPNAFGEFIKKKRIERGVTLRQFCRDNGFDWGNISRLERGKAKPPQSDFGRNRYAFALGLRPNSEEWREFTDLAFICAGRIPDYVMSDEELLPKLLVILRTISGEPLSREKLLALAEEIRRT